MQVVEVAQDTEVLPERHGVSYHANVAVYRDPSAGVVTRDFRQPGEGIVGKLIANFKAFEVFCSVWLYH